MRLKPSQYKTLNVKKVRKRSGKRTAGAMVELLAAQLRLAQCPAPEREFRFAPPRLWRFDFAWPERMIAAEYEGLFAPKARHTTISGYKGDLEKYNAAALNGWAVFRFMADHVTDGSALRTLEHALANKGQQ